LNHGGGLTQRCSFLPGVAAVDDVVGSLAVYANDFSREDSGRGTESVGDLDVICSEG
jgi:hypothetical protein